MLLTWYSQIPRSWRMHLPISSESTSSLPMSSVRPSNPIVLIGADEVFCTTASAPKPEWVDSVVPTFPGEKANNSWFQTVKGYAYLIFRMLPFLPSLLPGRWGPLALKVS
jgi:hypothetical protein